MLPHFAGRQGRACTVSELLRAPDERGGLPVFDDHTRARLAIVGGLDISSRKRKGSALAFLSKDNARAHRAD